MNQQITLSDDIIATGLPVRLGLVSARINNQESSGDLKAAMGAAGALVVADLKDQPASSRPEIFATRKLYKALGKDPGRYRPSAEALTRRLLQGKELYHISSAVDVTNLLSIRSGLSIGAYDREKIVGGITMRSGAEAEPYRALGRGDFNIANLPVFADDLGAFGSPTSDSERTCLSMETQLILMVLISVAPQTDLENWLSETSKALVQFAAATDVNTDVVAVSEGL